MNDPVLFYKIRHNGELCPYAEFCNFFRRSYNLGGHRWQHREAGYQAYKYLNPDGTYLNEERFNLVKNAKTPRIAKDLANDHSFAIRPDWDDFRITAMEWHVYACFSQNEDLGDILLSTGDRTIVEDSPIDYVWGWGADHSGRNELGKCLMRVRGMIQKDRSLDLGVCVLTHDPPIGPPPEKP